MRVFLWLFRGLLFILLLGLAIKNSGDVELKFFLDQRWLAPLSLVILAAFVVGAVAGWLAILPAWIRQRRQLAQALRAPAAGATTSQPQIIDAGIRPDH